MRVWDEEYVVKQLRSAREKAKTEEKKTLKPDESPIAFLLVLVRKFEKKRYEFLYIPATCYERIEDVYNKSDVVLTHAVVDDDEEDKEYGVWIGRSAESDDDNNNNMNGSFKINTKFESYYVGKAIFHTASGEPLMKMEGSCGWKEALKQKYQNLEARSRMKKDRKKDEENHTTAKAVAAAAIGGGAAAGGASVVAASTAAAATTTAIEAGTAYGAGAFAASGGFGTGYGAATGLGYYGAGYGASGLGYYGAGYGAASGLGYGGAAAGYGAAGYGGATGATSWASWAAANGIATGTSSTAAAAQTAGAASVMAPVGVVAAVGAVGGLGLYYVIHRRNQAKKAREKAIQEGVPSAEKLHEEEATVVTTDEDSSSEGEAPDGYIPLSAEHEMEDQLNCSMNNWVSLFVKRVDCDDSHYVFVPVVCANEADAEREFLHAQANNTVAKALFSPEGSVLQIAADPADHDGWETALALHYDFLEDHNLISPHADDDDDEEDSPLLDEEPVASQKNKYSNGAEQPSNWVFEAIRKKRQQLGQMNVPGPGAILSLRSNRASA